MSKEKSKKLTLKHLIGYGCGDAGGVITLYAVSGFMTRYLQVHLGVDAAVLATMLLVWNIWDTVNDPMMGTLMDISFAKAKPGSDKFRPWILASIPVMMFGMIAFFTIPSKLGGGLPMLAAAFILKIVYEGGYTMMNIGMGSLLGVMSTNDQERATLASARGLGSTAGGMLAGIGIPLIIAKFGDSLHGYAMVGIICAILGGIVVFLHYALTEERNKAAQDVVKSAEESEAEKVKFTDIIDVVKNNRAFLALVLHSVCICAVQAMGQGAAQYFYLDVLGDISLQSAGSGLSSALMFAILFSAPLLTKKWDLVAIIRFCLAAGFILYGGLFAYAMLAPQINGMLFVMWNALAGGLVTMSVQMQWGLVAEAIDYNEYLSGKRNEGTIYGFFSLSRRIGSTIAGSASVLLIAAFGYNAEAAAQGLAQTAQAITGLKILMIGFPMIAAVGSFCSFTFVWNINKDVRAKMAAWKEAKAAKTATVAE